MNRDDVALPDGDPPSPTARGPGLRGVLLQRAWPGVPVIVLSPTLHPGVTPQGETARQLGAAAALPTPVSRPALLSAVARLLPD